MSHRSPTAGFMALAVVYATAGVLAVVPTPWTKVGAAGLLAIPDAIVFGVVAYSMGRRLGPIRLLRRRPETLRLRQDAKGALVLNQHGSWTFPNGVRGAAARL